MGFKMGSAVLVALVSFSACSSSGASDSSSDTTAPSGASSETEDTSSTSSSSTVPETTDDDMIAKIGYGHVFDSGYLEIVRKSMNGNQMNQYSEAQLFNYARNTCTNIKGGDSQKMIDLLKSTQGTADHDFTVQMTLAALNFYCRDLLDGFLEKATKAGL